MYVLGCFMHSRVWLYECRVRKGKILFPGFIQCEKRVELSGHEAKTLIVIFNLFGYGQPSVEAYLALSTRTELRIRFAWRHRTKRGGFSDEKVREAEGKMLKGVLEICVPLLATPSCRSIDIH